MNTSGMCDCSWQTGASFQFSCPKDVDYVYVIDNVKQVPASVYRVRHRLASFVPNIIVYTAIFN